MIYLVVVVVALLIPASLEEHTGCTVCDVNKYCSSNGLCCEIKNVTTQDKVPR